MSPSFSSPTLTRIAAASRRHGQRRASLGLQGRDLILEPTDIVDILSARSSWMVSRHPQENLPRDMCEPRSSGFSLNVSELRLWMSGTADIRSRAGDSWRLRISTYVKYVAGIFSLWRRPAAWNRSICSSPSCPLPKAIYCFPGLAPQHGLNSSKCSEILLTLIPTDNASYCERMGENFGWSPRLTAPHGLAEGSRRDRAEASGNFTLKRDAREYPASLHNAHVQSTGLATMASATKALPFSPVSTHALHDLDNTSGSDDFHPSRPGVVLFCD